MATANIEPRQDSSDQLVCYFGLIKIYDFGFFIFRTYWASDIQWTWDDLLVICILQQGSVSIIPRLGEPLVLQTFGQSIEMGPRQFLPLLPRISVQ